MQQIEEMKCDVLVVGTEVGGARAAIEAAKQDLQVLMVNKGIQAKGGVTQLAVYSCNAALGYQDERDNPQIHFEDTVRGGRFINNQKLVEIFCEEAPERVLEMEDYGLKWTRKDGKIFQGIMPGSTHPRACHVGYRTGVTMVKALKAEVGRHPNIKVKNDLYIEKLIASEDGEVIGAVGLDLKEGKPVFLSSKTTVLAAGSALYLYRFCSGTHEGTGDGYALAYQMGAKLSDMEFVQFFPTGTAYPKSLEGTMGPCTQRYWLNAHLYNDEGERFMQRYAPVEMEKTTRDILARAIFMEIIEGRGTPHGGVWLDCTHLAPNIIEAQVEKFFGGSWVWSGVDVLKFDLDPRVKAVEATPVPHFFMGGVKINEECATGVRGLFVAGELAVGIDGANRIAGNALSHCLVTGKRAGEYAAKYAKTTVQKRPNTSKIGESVNDLFGIFDASEGESPVRVRKELQEMMWRLVGVIREKKGLEEALRTIEEMKVRKLKLTSANRRYNKEWLEALELKNLMLVAEMVTRSALLREESRGAHYRKDFPDPDNKKFLKNHIVQKVAEKMQLHDEPVVITKLQPEEK